MIRDQPALAVVAVVGGPVTFGQPSAMTDEEPAGETVVVRLGPVLTDERSLVGPGEPWSGITATYRPLDTSLLTPEFPRPQWTGGAWCTETLPRTARCSRSCSARRSPTIDRRGLCWS